ncbi:hypothetical protein [Parvibium lacunae]|uniref:Uncharacterized protein n=1 Tax=Parvibium lacunae TaxID=1888893 RepID=A0A368L7T0_9BURK|nr:hypothetical protein [Parvibium lacunae]RCS59725.1 hypothetical protein DU000_03180 [Parvibium lacunae]
MNDATNLPATLVAGDSLSWTDDVYVDDNNKSYTSATYTLTYYFRGPGAGINVAAVANGSGWKTTLTAPNSAPMAAGQWFYVAVLSNQAGERVTISSGQIEVTPDLTRIDTPYDGRSLAEKALADAEAALASFKSTQGKIKRYTIADRTMEFASVPELLQLINYWKVRVNSERTAKQIANGLGDPRRLLVRFR